MTTQLTKREPRMASFVAVWVGLLIIVAIEVALTYQRPSAKTLLAWLLCLAFIEASVAALYMMHLRYESPKLFWSLIPITLFCLVILNYLWSDAYRIVSMGALK